MLIRAYYGAGPASSYYDGCSQGGRMGLIFAQRFPTDFSGIVAGAPMLDYTGTTLARAYRAQKIAALPIPPKDSDCRPTQSTRSATPKTA
jgi:poly(3-hydroxybutyrate) depolymerase